ncbi:MAG: hypothetical protein M3430_08340 [Acidobacteriota bacterium]|nr:hypothetical protein [Acidobacteriota bacterium]
MRRFIVFSAGLLILTLALTGEARAQWQDGSLAVKTNGNNVQSGDRLRVEIFAVGDINESFYTQVSYKFSETVRVKDEDGKESDKEEERVRTRPAGPALEGLGQFKSLVLDDTFNFGEGSPAGRYVVEVGVFRAYSNERVATIRSCVFLQNSDRAGDECPTFLRGVKQNYAEYLVNFDGAFSQRGRYTATLFAGGKLVKHIEAGVFASSAKELTITSDKLGGTPGKTFDILVHDRQQNYSSTLARVTIPSAQ